MSILRDASIPEGLKHPARFSRTILELIEEEVDDYSKTFFTAERFPLRILDPFAGTGRIHKLTGILVETYGVEIEPEWANMHPRTIVGNALALPFRTFSMDMVITSPTYGNRLADHHRPKEGSLRRSYTFDLRRATGDATRQLHPSNTGSLAFGAKYKEMHLAAWKEVWRVLRPGSRFILNVSDHVRAKKVVEVADWHLGTCVDLGFDLVRDHKVETPRLRNGANHDSRVPYESVFVLARPR